MMLLDAMFWLLTSHCGTYIEPISRRFANLSYILWMVSVGIHPCTCPIPSSVLVPTHIPSRTLADLPCFQTPIQLSCHILVESLVRGVEMRL